MPAPKPVHELFTQEQKDDITALYNGGFNHQQIAVKYGYPRRTIMKLCNFLGLNRSRQEAASLVIKSKLDTPEVIEQIRSLRQTTSLEDIAAEVGGSVSAIQRICEKYSIGLDQQQFTKLQSERMAEAWTEEKKEKTREEVKKRFQENPEIASKIGVASKKTWANEEYRQKQIRIQKEIWSKPEKRRQLAEMRLSQGGMSSLQTILYGLLTDLDIKFFREYEDKEPDLQCVIGPYNFDCVIPREGGKTLIIECQGDYWHSQERHSRNDKSKETFLTRYFPNYEIKYLWEHEFKCKDKVVEVLKYWLGKTKHELIEYDFSQLVIKPAEAKDYKLLLSKYHYLPNAGRGGIAYGAFLGNELIAVCVFSNLPRQNIEIPGYSQEEVRELSRLCVNPRYQKKNFASWFVSRCIKQLPEKYKVIISYCDTTFNHNGATYKALNFRQDLVVRPDYWYTDRRGWVMHKKTLYNHACKMNMTESEYAEKNGFIRVYGSEKIRFIFERTK